MNQNFNVQDFYNKISVVTTTANDVEPVLQGYIKQAQDMMDCIGPVDGGKIYEQWANIQTTTTTILEKYKERKDLFLNHLKSYVDNVLASNQLYYTELQSSSEKLNSINSRLGSL